MHYINAPVQQFLCVSCDRMNIEHQKYVRLVCSVASMYGNPDYLVVCWCCGTVFGYDSKSHSRSFFFNYLSKL